MSVRAHLAKTFFVRVPNTDDLDVWVERNAADYWDFGDYELEVEGFYWALSVVPDTMMIDASVPHLMEFDVELSFEPKGGKSNSIIWAYKGVATSGHHHEDTTNGVGHVSNPMVNIGRGYIPFSRKISKGQNIYFNISTKQRVRKDYWNINLWVVLYCRNIRLVTSW